MNNSNAMCVVTADVINFNDIDNPTTLLVGLFDNEIVAMNELNKTPFELPDYIQWDSIEYHFHNLSVNKVCQ